MRIDSEQVWIRKLVQKKNGFLRERWTRVKNREAIRQLLGYTPDKVTDLAAKPEPRDQQ